MRWKRDLVVGVVFSVLCIAGYFYSFTIASGGQKGIASPAGYMQLWLVIMLVLGVILIKEALKKKDMSKGEEIITSMGIATSIAMIVYVFSMPYIGFFITTFLFLLALMVIYSLKKLDVKPAGNVMFKFALKYAVIALITTIATQQIFANGLKVTLPGPGFGLF